MGIFKEFFGDGGVGLLERPSPICGGGGDGGSSSDDDDGCEHDDYTADSDADSPSTDSGSSS